MKLPCDTDVNITSGLLREDKLPAAVNVNIFLNSRLSDGPFSNLLWRLLRMKGKTVKNIDNYDPRGTFNVTVENINIS